MNYVIDKNTDEKNIVEVSVFGTWIKQRCCANKLFINTNLVMIICHKFSLCKKMVCMLCATLVDPLNSEELVCFKFFVHCEEGATGPATDGGDKHYINGNKIGSVDTVKVPPKNNESTTIESSVNISHPPMTTVVSKTSTTKVRSSNYTGWWKGNMDMAKKGHVKLKLPEKVDPTTKKPYPEGQYFQCLQCFEYPRYSSGYINL